MCDIILKDVYIPALIDPPAEFSHMVDVMIEGMKPVSPLLDQDAFMMFTRRICGVPDIGPPLANTYSRWVYNIQVYIHDVLLNRWWLAFVFRPLLNCSTRFSTWINIKFPLGAACKFGMKAFSRVPDRPHPVATDGWMEWHRQQKINVYNLHLLTYIYIYTSEWNILIYTIVWPNSKLFGLFLIYLFYVL